MDKQQGRCRWIPHHEMLMDTPTKRNENDAPLLKVMKTGCWKISSETTEMQAGREAKAQGKAIARPYNKKLKYEPGEDEMFDTGKLQPPLDDWQL